MTTADGRELLVRILREWQQPTGQSEAFRRAQKERLGSQWPALADVLDDAAAAAELAEEDEPVQQVVEAFERGPHGVTAPPSAEASGLTLANQGATSTTAAEPAPEPSARCGRALSGGRVCDDGDDCWGPTACPRAERTEPDSGTGWDRETIDAVLDRNCADITDDELAQLRALLASHDQLLSIVARIGDAMSPTGERPEEALGTLVADVEQLVDLVDELRSEVQQAQDRTALAETAVGELERERNTARAELADLKACHDRDTDEAELLRARLTEAATKLSEYIAKYDTGRRDAAADALEWWAGMYGDPSGATRIVAAEVRSGARTIPTSGRGGT